MSTVRVVALIAASAFALAACGGDDDEPGADGGAGGAVGGSPAAEVVSLPDPCELVAAADIESATGNPIKGEPTAAGGDFTPATCSWTTTVPSGESGITVGVAGSGSLGSASDQYEQHRVANAEVNRDVSGIGDAAFSGAVLADAGTEALSGDFIIFVIHSGYTEEVTEDLAGIAVGNL